MKISTVFVSVLALALSAQFASAQTKKKIDYPPLDTPYIGLKKPTKVKGRGPNDKSNTEAVIKVQTDVKSQGRRGTCSIFSATALLESLLIKKHRQPTTLNLSEEWLQYAISKGKTDDGSNARPNFNAIMKYGMPSEDKLKYIPESWKDNLDADLPTAEHGSRSRERCEHLEDIEQKSCLIGHWDTSWIDLSDDDLKANSEELFLAREQAFDVRDTYKFPTNLKINWISDTAKVKQVLKTGSPVLMSLDVYYGAWNHGRGNELGIDLDSTHWEQGIVAYPERDSVDYEKSPTKRAGHSVLVVGYDESVTIERTSNRKVPRVDATGKPVIDKITKKQIIDIKPVTKTYKGVYYFKNSWGKVGFGKNFKINGNPYPGYGMIAKDYAEEYGSFDQVTLK